MTIPRLYTALVLSRRSSTLFFTVSMASVCLFQMSVMQTSTFARDHNEISSQKVGDQVTPIEPGKPVERELRGGEKHTYEIHIDTGQFLHAVVEQLGIDVKLTLIGSDGKEIASMDSLNGSFGPEQISMIAESSGNYRLKVAAEDKSVSAGRYRVSIDSPHIPSDKDKARIKGERLSYEAEALREQAKAELYRDAVQKFAKALPLWRAAGDRYEEAMTLYSIGNVYSTLGEMRTALDYYNQALTIERELKDERAEARTISSVGFIYWMSDQYEKAIGWYEKALAIQRNLKDRAGEATSLDFLGFAYRQLNQIERAIQLYEQALSIEHELMELPKEAATLQSIGRLYDHLGEKQKALDYYNEALPLWRAAGDRSGEAVTLNNIGVVYQDLGEVQKALEYYDQALPLRRAAGDRSGEATTLNNIGGAYSELGEKQKALEFYNQALPLQRTVRDASGQAATLNNIGGVYDDLGEKQKALEFYNQALRLRHAAGDREGEAITLNNIAHIYSNLGEMQKALDYNDRSLKLSRAVGDRSGEATTLSNIGSVYDDLGEKQKALDYYNQALPLQRAVGNRSKEAVTLNNIGLVYQDLGEVQKALDYYNQALPLRRAVGDRSGEATTLNNIGTVYNDLGEMQKSLDFYNQALPVQRAVGDRSGEATTLNNIGHIYSKLGEMQKALEFYNQALPVLLAVGDRAGEARSLGNVGMLYKKLGEKQKALDYFNQALPLQRTVGDRSGEATTLNNIGAAYDDLGEKQKALNYYNKALALQRVVGDRSGEASTLNNIGGIYDDLGEKQKALDYYNQALPLRRAVGDRSGEATTLGNIAWVFHRLDPNLAIVFGKQAVSKLQSIRRDNKDLQDSVRASYEKSIEFYYRLLANLLVERERFGEAEEVLNLLKSKEASDFIRRDSVSDQLHAVTLLDAEKKALAHYDQIVNQIVDLGQRKTVLLAKVDRDHVPLTAAELEEGNRLSDELKVAKAVLLKYFDDLQRSFPSDSALSRRVTDFKDTAGLQDKLQKLGPDVVAIYTLVTPDKYVAMLVTSGARKAYTSPLKEDLNKKVFDFRQKLQDPTSDPLPLAQELYHVIFPEGLRQDLDSMHAKTIMWSIDSTLRYIPFSALHDGKQYLVENFRQSLITPASIPNLTEDPVRQWSGEGFGVSEGNSPLPSVPAELRGIFRETPNGNSPVPGVVRLNAAFTWENFKNDLRRSPKAVVHIATHYDSRPGVAANSQLLMGDGERSLADLASEDKLFHGVDLLTLSACNTGFTNRSEDGREVDSFAEIAQQLEAKGVIASLWSVNDDSTSSLMQTLYRLRQQTEGMTKDEALRQAQLALLTAKLKPATAQPVPDRSVVPNGPQTARRPPPTDWSHPYFWAPFILIGNWK